MSLTVNPAPQGFGDIQLIRQVYSNLLSNAVKFTKHRDVALIETGGFNDDEKETSIMSKTTEPALTWPIIRNYLEFSSVCIGRRNLRVQVLDWLQSSASSTNMAVASGRKAK